MKALVTGTEGFIGRNLKTELEKQGWEVVTFEERDLKDNWKLNLNEIFALKLDACFHVGACSDTLEQDVNYMMLLNYEVTKYLTDLCKQNQVKLIYSSSAANYGTNKEYPANLYGWSKYAGEGYVISNGGIALRYFNVYGPGEEDKGRMASVAYQMFKRHQAGEEVKLFRNKPLRDFVYIKDIVLANIFAFKNGSRAFADDLWGNWFEVGSGQAREFEEKMEILDIPYKYHPEEKIPKGYQFFTCSDRGKWMPNWRPEFQLEEGLQDYLNYLHETN